MSEKIRGPLNAAMTFFFMVSCLMLSFFAASTPQINAQEYKGPVAMIPTADGASIYVLNKDAKELAVLNAETMEVAQSFPLPEAPRAMVLSADGATLYITAGVFPGKVYAVATADGKILREGVTGHTPIGPTLSPDGAKLYVCYQFENAVAEFDTETLTEHRRFAALHEPCNAVITKDGRTIYAANFLPLDPSDGADVAAEISAIDTETGETKNIRLPNGSSSMHGICLSPDGKYVYTTAILARYQLPTSQLERGWMNTNGFSIIDAEKREFINTVLLDDVDLGAANPWPIATSPDGKKVYIGLAGTHEICIVDMEKTLEKLFALPKSIDEAKAAGNYNERDTIIADSVPQRLAFLVGLKKRVKLPDKAPRSLCVIGEKVYAGMYFSDTVDVVDTKTRRLKAKSFPLGPAPEWTPERRGELAWHDATLCFQHWQSCASCHPDARSDALNWDLLNDGTGNPKNAKGMLFSIQTPPAMWHGVRDKAETAIRTGFQYILFSVRPEETYTDIEAYLKALTPLPSPHLVNGALSEAALRGKAIFEREELGCSKCHLGEYYTDQKLHDVGSRAEYDQMDDFDTPTLREVWRTPPYMHDGRFVQLRDIFKVGNHGDVYGDVAGLSDEELDDLTEYILSL